MRSQKGFTLIEVMITIMILGTLTVLTAQAIQAAIKNKVKIQDQIDDVSRMRDAMRLIERDVNLAYHYRDIEKEMKDLIKKQGQGNQGQSQTTSGNPFGGNDKSFFGSQAQQQDPEEQKREVPRQDPATHFVGNNESMNFVTMNNARTVRNSVQADFVEVGYSLRDCKSLNEEGGTSKCLWRRTSPFVDDDVTKGGDEVVLLENISEFKLRYIGKGKQDWNNDWRTDQAGDAVTKNRFPQAVEVSLTVEKDKGGKKKKFSMQVVIPIHFPNNPEEAQNANQNSPSSWPQSNGPIQ